MAGHFVLAHASPDNGMRDNRICADEDDRIGQFQILKCVTGSVVTVSLLVAHRCGRHAQTGISVHVRLQVVSHDMAENSELLKSKLTGTDSGNALRSIFCLKFPEFICNMLETFLP